MDTTYRYKTGCNTSFIVVCKPTETHKRLGRHPRVNWFDSNMQYKIIECRGRGSIAGWCFYKLEVGSSPAYVAGYTLWDKTFLWSLLVVRNSEANSGRDMSSILITIAKQMRGDLEGFVFSMVENITYQWWIEGTRLLPTPDVWVCIKGVWAVYISGKPIRVSFVLLMGVFGFDFTICRS